MSTLIGEGISTLYKKYKSARDRKTFFEEEDVLIVETILMNRILWSAKKNNIFGIVADNSDGRWSIKSVGNRWYKYLRGHPNYLYSLVVVYLGYTEQDLAFCLN